MVEGGRREDCAVTDERDVGGRAGVLCQVTGLRMIPTRTRTGQGPGAGISPPGPPKVTCGAGPTPAPQISPAGLMRKISPEMASRASPPAAVTRAGNWVRITPADLPVVTSGARRLPVAARRRPPQAEHLTGHHVGPGPRHLSRRPRPIPGPAAAVGGRPGADDPPTGQRPARGEPGWLAERLLSEADQEAAAVKQQAREVADAIRHAADRKAEQIRQQAAWQARYAKPNGRPSRSGSRRPTGSAGYAKPPPETPASCTRPPSGCQPSWAGSPLRRHEPRIPATPAARPYRQAADDHTAPALPGASPRDRPHRQPGPGHTSPATPAAQPQALPADRPPTATAPRCPPPRHPPSPEASPIQAAGQRAGSP